MYMTIEIARAARSMALTAHAIVSPCHIAGTTEDHGYGRNRAYDESGVLSHGEIRFEPAASSSQRQHDVSLCTYALNFG